MAKSKTDEESTEEVFNFIDRVFAQEQEETFIKKLRDSICVDLDSRMRKITRDSGKTTPDISLYERLVSHLEGQILYLEDEVRKKDSLIEKLIDSNLDHSNKSKSKCSFCSLSTSKNSNSDRFANQPNDVIIDNKKKAVVEKLPSKTHHTPNGLIDFHFDENNISNDQTLNEEKSANEACVKKDQNERLEKRETVYVCGDSMVNGVDGDGISSKEFRTVVKSFGGSTSIDMIDYIKPSARKKPDKMVIHVGTNDITKNIENTVEHFDQLIKTVHDISPNTQICFSELCVRNDFQGSSGKVKRKNEIIRKFCNERNIALISNGNVDNSCLARKQLHLNQKGLKRLALNIKSFLEKR